MTSIDINCDMGEIPEAIADGTQESVMPSLTSVNIACGGHAGDEATMQTTIEQASRWNLAIGAHPGYPDRENFGRVDMRIPLSQIEATVFEQVRALVALAAARGSIVTHVKPHGQLYNQAAKDPALAAAIAGGVGRLTKDMVLVGLAGSIMLDVFRDAGFAVAAEAFADRVYEPDGTLRSRRFADAVIGDPQKAGEQALRIVQRGEVVASDGACVPVLAQTICVHGDTPGAPKVASAVAQQLRGAGIRLRPISR
jgi:UPF0271 protein